MSTALDWLKDFWKVVNPSPTDPVIMPCRPLVIANESGQVLDHFLEAEICFTPSEDSPRAGVAEVIKPEGAKDYWRMDVDEATFQHSNIPELMTGSTPDRGGARLVGHYGGERYTWFIDGSASDFVFAPVPKPDEKEEPPTDA